MGDPSGIGPEIVARSLPRLKSLADFVIIGDRWVIDKIRNPKSKINSKSEIRNPKFIDLNNVDHKEFSFGKIHPEYGYASIEYLDKAMELIKKKEIDCLVTAPISKEAINLAGFRYSGHTEYFEEKTGCKDTVMMLLNKRLKFSLLTRHIPLKNVSAALKQGKLAKVIMLTDKSLKELFLIKFPRIVVCGLNPHASDNGIIGSEENNIIKPVLVKLRRKIKYLAGPLSSDVAIKQAKDGAYDCVIAMYHDQALIPLKLLGDKTGVNLTLGLPFIRTSPLHGTAYDIAGRNLASPDSLIAAVQCALQCRLKRKKA